MTEERQDPNTLIAALSRDQVNLSLETFHLCCLAGLYLRADRAALASFEEDLLVDLFEQVCDVVEPGAENPKKRATHAIQRLRDQHMLTRIDGAGVVHAGEYALTRLAAAVIEYFMADEALTRESLTLLTRTLLVQLSDVKGAASRATTVEDWKSNVIGPLRITVGDLIGGIERRQRGLDAAQEQVQEEIARLLVTDWFGAVDRSQDLLDETTATLRELNEVLLRDANQFLALLQEIQALAEDAGQLEAEEAVQRVVEQVDRIVAWGSARQRAWSNYYQYVHGYLRDVVRLDPDRALSQRLRDQISDWTVHPFHLAVASSDAIRLLRPVENRVEKPPVSRPRGLREQPLDEVGAEDLQAVLEDLVKAGLRNGAVTLSEVTGAVLEELPEPRRFGAAGRVAAVLSRLTRVRSERERGWVRVNTELEVEEWRLAPEGAHLE